LVFPYPVRAAGLCGARRCDNQPNPDAYCETAFGQGSTCSEVCDLSPIGTQQGRKCTTIAPPPPPGECSCTYSVTIGECTGYTGCPSGQECQCPMYPNKPPSERCGPGTCVEITLPSLPPVPVVSCIPTAIGCIDFRSPNEFVNNILRLAIGLAGGIAMLLIIFGGIQILTSAGNPEKIQAGKELITSAIAGLTLIVFSVFILRIIGVEILDIF